MLSSLSIIIMSTTTESDSSDTECLTASDGGCTTDDTLPVENRYAVRLMNKGSFHRPILILYDVLGRPLLTSTGRYHNIMEP